ncbi:MAG TPA: ABC transporter permease [Acidimicrobiales bacterium]|nr:ABC transporter permease [Acidimicrobiales bacterium]
MIAAEFSKQLRRWRTLILIAVCVVTALLVAVLMGQNAHNHPAAAGPDGISISVTSSGLVLGIIALFFASHLLTPITFLVYYGDPMASEAKWGSLRYLLVRPVSRSRVLSAKVIVSTVLALGSLLIIPIVASLVGIAYFGLHPVTTGHFLAPLGLVSAGPSPVIPVLGTLGRFLLATGYVALDSAALAGVAVLLAVVTENVLAAVASAAGLYIFSAILGALPGNFINRIDPALPTHYFDAWLNLFQPGTSLAGMTHGVVTQLSWFVLTLGAAYVVFNRKDVKC